jgi:sugar phosphate isomerase/epimerase
MPAKIGIQLYTVRDALAQDFDGVVRKIAAMGYVGVETAGFPGTTPEKAGALFKELGLQVPGAHVPLPLGDQQQQVLELMDAIGCQRIIAPVPPKEANHYQTLDDTLQACDLFNQANAVAQAHGLTFGVHNHTWEFGQVEGQYVYQVLLEHLEPEIFFQIDTYWVKTAGLDPVKVVKELGSRAPLLHLKDGPCVWGEPMVALGNGDLEISEIVRAGGTATEWLIVELDRTATDVMEAVEQSYRFLVDKGLALGNQA